MQHWDSFGSDFFGSFIAYNSQESGSFIGLKKFSFSQNIEAITDKLVPC